METKVLLVSPRSMLNKMKTQHNGKISLMNKLTSDHRMGLQQKQGVRCKELWSVAMRGGPLNHCTGGRELNEDRVTCGARSHTAKMSGVETANSAKTALIARPKKRATERNVVYILNIQEDGREGL